MFAYQNSNPYYYPHQLASAAAQALVHAPVAASQPALVSAPAPVPNGGVSLVLDYDLDHMARFLSWVSFGLLAPSSSITSSSAFHASISAVLSATRLPKSTILLAINYLSCRTESSSPFTVEATTAEHNIFKTLITSLILANKFNDDKTFKNKSWADATNLPLGEINILEREWLASCDYQLAKTNAYSMVESCWNTWCAQNPICAPSIPSAPSSPLLSTTSPSNGRSYSSGSDFELFPNQIFENPFLQSANDLYYNYYQMQPAPAPMQMQMPPQMQMQVPMQMQMPLSMAVPGPFNVPNLAYFDYNNSYAPPSNTNYQHLPANTYNTYNTYNYGYNQFCAASVC